MTNNNFTTFGKNPSLLKSDITATSSAIDVLCGLIESTKSKGLVFTVTGGGCSGYIYDLELIKEEDTLPSSAEVVTFKSESDNKREVKLYIPYPAIPLLKETEIWYDDKVVGGGIKFKNPNAKRTCGCGESFS